MLETKRLSLRPFQSSDRLQALALLADSGFMAFSAQGPLTGLAAEDRFLSLVKNAQDSGYGKLALRRKGEDRIFGYCGIEPAVVEGRPEFEIGFRMLMKERRQGFIREAAEAVISDYFQRSRAAYLLAYVEPANSGSLIVVERLGFTFQRMIQHHNRPFRLFCKPAPPHP